ncbi:hypothetical protein Taro_032923 [Colocasia esculenta]|uniref:Uncharacterized protein n=1 Tax=Colocasia esculenta TaxID=4460 RepID=A0A843WAX1_COLES|nr:hypothetical protein [Colocasia esculenta]
MEASNSVGLSPSHISSDPSPSHISGAPSRSHISGASSPSHSSVDSSLFQPSELFGGIYIFCSRGTGHRGPTRGVIERRLPNGQQWNVSLVQEYGMGPTADHFTSRMGVVSKMYCKIWQKDFAKLPVATKELIFRDLQLTYQWERTEKIDREMLGHMSAMHRSWRSKQKKRHFNGKSLDDTIASVPPDVDSSYWQSMCEMWTTGDEQSNMHRRTLHRLELFKMGRCKNLPDSSESWVDEESRRRYEAMTQMIAPSSDVDAESHTPATPKDAFISVMGKDRPDCVHCAGSGETLSTWYKSTGTSVSSERERIMQEQLKGQEEKLKAQEEEMTQMREKISLLENVATKVDEMSILLS